MGEPDRNVAVGRAAAARAKRGPADDVDLGLPPSTSLEHYIHAYREMYRARKIDEKAILLYKQNKCHFQIGCAGHEAVQVAAANTLKPGYDWAYPYYRDMAFNTAWGVTSRELFLGILNKADDPASGGRQMPMHFGHKKLNIVSQSSPTGTQFLQAVGAAKAIRYMGGDQVVYVSSGEGTTAQGAYYESLNWAAREKLPVIYLIEDNKFAISVHISEQIAGASVSKVARGFEGFHVETVNGTDYVASLGVLDAAVARARKGDGPSLIVAEVVRLQSHSISDNQAKYRTAEEISHDKANDPLIVLANYLLKENALTEQALRDLETAISQEVDEAAAWAETQADPEPHTALFHVLRNPDPGVGIEEREPEGEELFMVEALNRALDEEMIYHPEMVIFGQDVAYGKGGVFSVTQGLTDKYGEERVFNSPLAEESICGTAIGMATLGLKPVVEIQFGDYIWTGMMQLRDELPMMLYRSNGEFSSPAVIRVAVGGYIRGGLYHSQNIEAFFSHIPGLLVIYPSNAGDAKGLLKSAIRAEDPVLFLEHKGLYRQVYSKSAVGGADDLIPIGRGKIIRSGDKATLVTWGATVYKSLPVVDKLAKEGIQIEVIDLRTIAPLDIELILKSVKKTGRLLVVHEDTWFMGFGAEIAAQVSEIAFDYLDAPVKRIGATDTPIPHAPVLEEFVLPQAQDIEEGLREILSY